MRRVAILVSAAAVVLFAAGLSAQGKNFAGKWAPDAEKNAAAMAGAGGGGGGRGGGGGGGEMTIAQDAKTLTITRTMGQNEVKTVYNLDGTESKNTMQGRGGPTEQVSKATWSGDKLVIETTSQGQNGPQVTKVTWYLEGGELVQERAPRQEGGTPTKTYYKKAM